MNKIPPSLNMLKPERAFMLKWLSPEDLSALVKVVLNMTPAQYRLLKYGWGIGDGTEG